MYNIVNLNQRGKGHYRPQLYFLQNHIKSHEEDKNKTVVVTYYHKLVFNKPINYFKFKSKNGNWHIKLEELFKELKVAQEKYKEKYILGATCCGKNIHATFSLLPESFKALVHPNSWNEERLNNIIK